MGHVPYERGAGVATHYFKTWYGHKMCPDLPAATQKQIYGNVVVPGAAGDVPRRATQEDQQVIPVPQPQPRQGR